METKMETHTGAKTAIDWRDRYLPVTEAAEIADPVREKYEREGDPYYGTARLWDDGIIDPVHTRPIVALALSAALNAPVGESKAPVYRM